MEMNFLLFQKKDFQNYAKKQDLNHHLAFFNRQFKLQCLLTVLYSETRPNAKPETVSRKATRQPYNKWTTS